MVDNARSWRLVVGGVAAGIAGVMSFAGATAWAEPVMPQPSYPAPTNVAAGQAGATAPLAPSAATPLAQSDALSTQGLLQQTAPAAAAQPAAPAPVPATSGSLTDFLHDKAVQLEPQSANGFTALTITLPMPPGWTHVPDPNVPDAFAVIADRDGGDGLYTSNAQLVVYKLVGDFDANEAITHGYIDSQSQMAWQSTDASMAEFGGFPSSVIEGTYRQNDMTLNTSRRHVIATAGPDRYLVTLSVSTSASQAVAAGPSTDAIINGFRVALPGAPAAPAPAAVPGAVPPAAAATPAAPPAAAATALAAPAPAPAAAVVPGPTPAR